MCMVRRWTQSHITKTPHGPCPLPRPPYGVTNPGRGEDPAGIILGRLQILCLREGTVHLSGGHLVGVSA